MSPHAPLIVDIAGPALVAADMARLRHPLVGGLILFARNWTSREQLIGLCQDIKRLRADLLITVDHEGGRVQRFKTDGFTHLPPMRSLGELWKHSVPGDSQASALSATRAATACGFVMGAELRACGVDLTFAPVLDLDHGASSVIGDRAFAAEASVVTLLAKSLVHGLLQSGMANCAKHFPGHGFAKADSHTGIALDRRSLEAILAQDAAPYGWLNTSLSAVMPAHVVYPKVDSRPAGFSEKWLTDVLRSRLGFDGAIFSDDLSMVAAGVVDGHQVGFAQAAVAALNAGCSMVLLCNQSLNGSTVIDEVLADLMQAHREGRWHSRSADAQRRLDLLPTASVIDWDALMVHPAYMRALDLIP